MSHTSTGSSLPSPIPRLLPALYKFRKTLLLPFLKNEGQNSHLAYFTFLAVSAACVLFRNKDDWEIIVCVNL